MPTPTQGCAALRPGLNYLSPYGLQRPRLNKNQAPLGANAEGSLRRWGARYQRGSIPISRRLVEQLVEQLLQVLEMVREPVESVVDIVLHVGAEALFEELLQIL